MGEAPLICVGVPVWNASAYVGETLSSILTQHDVRFCVFISVDGNDTASEQACLPWLDDPRVKLVRQPKRLGWVGNSATVLSAALETGASYACLQPADDLMRDGYLATLLEVAEASPAAAVVFSDIEAFGRKGRLIEQPSVTGSPLARQTAILLDHFTAIAYRGLTRVSALSAVPPIGGGRCPEMGVDTVWMARLARQGELIRVPQALYRKRYHEANTHVDWSTWSDDRKLGEWTNHCLDMLSEALPVAASPGARRLLVDAARLRLLQGARPLGPYADLILALPPNKGARLLAAFDRSAEAECTALSALRDPHISTGL